MIERRSLAEDRISELSVELATSERPLDRYFHALFLLLLEQDPEMFWRSFGDGFEGSFADAETQSEDTRLPKSCEHSLRLLMRECADCLTFSAKGDRAEGTDSVFGFGADLIYMELALEVFSYVSEVTEGRTGAEEQIQDEVILEKIASMHHAYDTEYIEYRYDTIFNTDDSSSETNGVALWQSFCEDPEAYYCGLPFDAQAHEHMMQKIAEHPKENRYSDVIAYLMDNASGQTVGFNGNVVKLPFFLKALSDYETLPFRLSFYAVEYHPALFLQGYGGLYTKLADAFVKQRRIDAQFLQKYLPTGQIRQQIQDTENRRKQGLETLHIVKL